MNVVCCIRDWRCKVYRVIILGALLCVGKINRVCVYSNSRNDVPRLAQRYGTIAAHTRRRASVLVVFVVFCVHMHSFAGLIGGRHRQRSVILQSPTTTLIPLFSTSELTGCGYPGLLDRENLSDMCPPVGVEPSTSCMQGEHPIH